MPRRSPNPGASALLGCESTWTRGNSPTDPNNPTIEVDPPSNLPVVTTPDLHAADDLLDTDPVTDPGNQQSFTGSRSESAGGGVGHQRRSDADLSAATGLPAGLSINGSTGLISGAPTVKGRSKVTVTASDTYDSVSARFLWKVKTLRVRRR